VVLSFNPLAAARANSSGKSPLQQAKQAHFLLPGKPIDREIQGDESHLYHIEVSADQYVRIAVEQRGIDVVIAVSRPDGQLLMEADGPYGAKGTESISLVAEESGVYSLQIRPLVKTAPAGRYEAAIVELRASTSLDARRIMADQAFRQAQPLLSGGTDASRKSAIEKYTEVLSVYKMVDDSEGAVACLYFIGMMNRALGKLALALENFHEALALARSVGNYHLQGTLLRESAKVFFNRKERQKALEVYGEAIAIARTAGDQGEEAIGLNDVGWVYRASSDHQKALEYFEQALTVSRAGGDELMESSSLNNMALSYIDMS
jgi:hypothetical protein